MSTLVATAPGKLILLGEHAAVYGHPAVTTGIGLWATATFEPQAGEVLTVELSDIGAAFEEDHESLRIYAAAAQRAWRRSTVDPTPQSLAPASAGDESHLTRVACGEVVAALGGAGRGPLPGGRLSVRSEIPVGAGFGSSAATATAVIGVLLAAAGVETSPETIEPIALEVERRQHGTPSGIDHNTVLRGGTLVARTDRSGARRYTPIELADGALEGLRVFDTGTPSEPTGRVVSTVKRRRRDNPTEVESLLTEMGQLVESVIGALEGGTADFGPVFRSYERCLERLGVVPPAVQRAVRAVESRGGGAKISGAGCHTGDAAGCLLVALGGSSPNGLPAALGRYREIEVDLGVPGLRVEAR